MAVCLEDFRRDNKTIKAQQVMAAAARQWKELAEAEKVKYEAPASEAKAVYTEAMRLGALQKNMS